MRLKDGICIILSRSSLVRVVLRDLTELFEMTMDRGAPLTAGDQPPACPISRGRVAGPGLSACTFYCTTTRTAPDAPSENGSRTWNVWSPGVSFQRVVYG